MFNRRFQALLVTALCLAASQAQAQTAVTFEDCIKEAIQNNYDLKVAEQTVKADEDAHIASFGQWFPQLGFNASISRNGDDGTLGGAFADPNYNQTNGYNFTATQTIFTGFRDFAAVDSANAALDNARAQLTQAKATLSSSLKTDFYQLLYYQKQVDLLKATLERDKANRDLVQMNFKGGSDNKGSYMVAEATVKQDELNIVEAGMNIRVAQRALNQVLGRSPMENLKVEGQFDETIAPEGTPNFAELTLETPAHLEAVASLHTSQASYISARSVFFPTLTANASIGAEGAAQLDGVSNSGWSATLNLSFPFFTGGKNEFSFKAAEENKLGAEDTLKSTDLKTESSLESNFASYVEAIDQNKVQEFEVKAAQTQEEIAKGEYLNGLLIFENWEQIEGNLTTQLNTQLSDLLAIKTAEAAWELTQGKGVIP